MRSPAPLPLSAVLVLLTSTIALAGPADDLSRAAVSGLSAMQISGATVGEARDDGTGAVLSNVTFASTGGRPVSVGVDRVTVTGNSGTGDALTGARIVLEGVKGIGSDNQSYRADRVEIVGAQGSFAAILGSLATREPFLQGASEASATGFSAQSIDIPAMTLQRRREARQEEVAYRSIRLVDYQRGKTAEMTIAGIVTRPQEGQTGERIEVGPSRFAGFDVSAGTRPGNTATVAMESGSIEQIRGTTAQNAPFSIERITFGRVAMRPGERSLIALTQDMQEIDPTGTSEESRRRSIGVAAELFSRLDIERVELTNFKGQTRENLPVAMARFVINGVSQGRITAIEFGGLEGAARGGQRTTIARFAIEDIDATGLIALGKEFSAGAFAPGKPIPHSAYPDVRRLVIEAVDVTNGAGQRLGKLERLDVEAGPRIGLVPTRLRARVTGFEAPVTNPRQRAQLAPIGVTDRINLGAELEMDYREDSRELRMRTFTVDVDGVGALNLVMTIGGLERAQVEGLPGSAAILGLSAKAGPLSLTFTENGGVESFISHLAGQTGLGEGQFREQLKQQAAMTISRYVQDADLAERIAAAFGAFIDNPTSLAISATPKGDVPLAALAVALRSSPVAAIPMFDIDVRANR